MPPLRTQQRTQSFYKTSEASNGPPETTRDTHNNFSGRHVDNGKIKGRAGRPSGRNPTVLATLGACMINQEKSVLSPSHTIQFLGFIVDSALMMISLPQKKVEDIANTCQAALLQGTLSVQDLSRLIGQMSATMRAVLPAPLCYQNLQRIKNLSLSCSHSFEAMVTLDDSAKEELLWWVHQLATWNGRTILSETPDLVVESDTSLLGWGAVSGRVRTGGLWSEKERTQHINYLELMAGTLAVRTFAKHKRNIHVRLRMDNQTAIFYVNRMGGTRVQSLVQPPCQLWQWCLQRG